MTYFQFEFVIRPWSVPYNCQIVTSQIDSCRTKQLVSLQNMLFLEQIAFVRLDLVDEACASIRKQLDSQPKIIDLLGKTLLFLSESIH
jgi:hypothetical protein